MAQSINKASSSFFRNRFKIKVLVLCAIGCGIFDFPVKAQQSFLPNWENGHKTSITGSTPHVTLASIPAQVKGSSTFEQRRNRKAIGCLGLVAGTFMKIQSRTIYNEYLVGPDDGAKQSLYNQANALHKASLVTMALSSVVFVIPIR
jgi:hypothetical protein